MATPLILLGRDQWCGREYAAHRNTGNPLHAVRARRRGVHLLIQSSNVIAEHLLSRQGASGAPVIDPVSMVPLILFDPE